MVRANTLPLASRQHPARFALVIAHFPVEGGSVIAASAPLAPPPLGVVLAVTLAGRYVADPGRDVPVFVAVAFLAPLGTGGVPVAPDEATFAVLPGRPVLARVANAHASGAVRVEVAPAVDGAVVAGPTQVAFADELRLAETAAVDARMVAGSIAVVLPVARVAASTFTTERAVRVRTYRVLVTIVQAETALVHVRAVRVRPPRLRHVQNVRARHLRPIEIALHARAHYRVLRAVAPTAAQRRQAHRTVRVRLARLALVGPVRREVKPVLRRRRRRYRGFQIEPLAAQPELVLARVDGEAEALLRRLAPDATASNVQARAAVVTGVARDRTLPQGRDDIVRADTWKLKKLSTATGAKFEQSHRAACTERRRPTTRTAPIRRTARTICNSSSSSTRSATASNTASRR